MTTLSEEKNDRRVTRASVQRTNRRAEILEVALSVFACNGYHQTRVSDIIEAAGIARGTFYLYFDSKSAIFLELLGELLSHLRGSVMGVDMSPSAPPVEQQLIATVRRIVDTIVRNRLLTTIVIREAVGLDSEVDGRLREFYGSLLQYIQEALEEGKRLHIVRNLDSSSASLCILGSFKQLMEHYAGVERADPQEVERVITGILDFHLRGILTTHTTSGD